MAGRRESAERFDLARLVRDRVGRVLRGVWAGLPAEARAAIRELTKSRGKNTNAKPNENYLVDEVCKKIVVGE